MVALSSCWRFVFIIHILTTMKGAIVKSGLWVRDRSYDDLTPNTSALWVTEGIATAKSCVNMCVGTCHCREVFYSSRSKLCQGHDVNVKLNDTVNNTGNILFSKVFPAPTSFPIRSRSSDGLVFDLYVSETKSWFESEAICDGLGHRLIRLDTEKKVNLILAVIFLYPATTGRDVYVGGLIENDSRDVYWHSGQCDFWKRYGGEVRTRSNVAVFKANSAGSDLQLHYTPDDPRMYICEVF